MSNFALFWFRWDEQRRISKKVLQTSTPFEAAGVITCSKSTRLGTLACSNGTSIALNGAR